MSVMAPGDEIGKRRHFPDGVQRVDDGERPTARKRRTSRSSLTATPGRRRRRMRRGRERRRRRERRRGVAALGSLCSMGFMSGLSTSMVQETGCM